MLEEKHIIFKILNCPKKYVQKKNGTELRAYFNSQADPCPNFPPPMLRGDRPPTQCLHEPPRAPVRPGSGVDRSGERRHPRPDIPLH